MFKLPKYFDYNSTSKISKPNLYLVVMRNAVLLGFSCAGTSKICSNTNVKQVQLCGNGMHIEDMQIMLIIFELRSAFVQYGHAMRFHIFRYSIQRNGQPLIVLQRHQCRLLCWTNLHCRQCMFRLFSAHRKSQLASSQRVLSNIVIG